MPLPTDTKIPLHGYSRQDEAVPNNPKQAMVVRLSDNLLQALEAAVLSGNESNLAVRFNANGGKPGIIVNDKFYPMQPIPENAPHDIYLRTSQLSKGNAPLKQHARVTGKFLVENMLGGGIEEKLGREKQVEEERRKKGRIELIDPIPASTSATKKKKPTASSAAPPRKTVEHSRNASLSTSNSVVPSRVTSPLPPRISPEPGGIQSTRSRMIHCLALEVQPQTADELLKRTGQANVDADRRRNLMNIIADIADQTGKHGHLRLKTRSWKEIRPYEWRNLSDRQRESMASRMRSALQELKAPRTDPVWHHLEPPTPPPSIPASKSASLSASMSSSSSVGRVAQPLPAKPSPEVVQASTSSSSVKPNGTTSTKQRVKKAEAAGSKAHEPIQAKDEGMHATRMSEPRLRPPGPPLSKNEGARREKQDSPSEPEGGSRSAESGTQRSAARRQLGSAIKKASPPDGSPVLPTAPIPTASAPPPRRTAPADGRGPRRQSPEPSGRARAAPPIPPPARGEARDYRREEPPAKGRASEAGATSAQRVKTEIVQKGNDLPRASGRERDTPQEQKPLRIKKKEKPKVEEGEIEQDEKPPPRPTNMLKRKIKREEESERESDVARLKKRRLPEEAQTARSMRPDVRDARSSSDRRLVKREASPPPRKVKRRPSPTDHAPDKEPIPGSRKVKEPSPAASQQSGKSKSSTSKTRRDLAVYTSSEDEGEIREPPPRARPAPTKRVKVEAVEEPLALSRVPAVVPLPEGSDHVALRAHYKRRYAKYTAAYSRLYLQVQTMESALDRSSDYSDGGSDVEIMDEDELRRATAEFRAIEEELKELRAKFDDMPG